MAAEALHAQIDRERKATSPQVSDLKIYRRYVEGNHDATLSPEMKTLLGAASKYPYADNVADMVLAAWSSRLTLTAFEVDDEPVREFLDDFYTRNHLGDLSYDTNYATGRDGNHALMLRWLSDDRASQPLSLEAEAPDVVPSRTTGQVTVHTEDWWDGECGVWVAYDDRGRPAYAVKEFLQPIVQDDGRVVQKKRRTVYFPGRIERYIEEGRGWAAYSLPDEPGHIVPWTKRDGSPLGIPVVHFSFPRFGKRRYGVSELAGGFLASQDHLNDVQQDLTAAARLLGFQILWSTGVAWQTTPKLEPGTFLYAEGDAAKFGNIPAGDLKQLIDTHGLKLQTIARMTATPIHIITGGDWPAGIALVQAEKPLIAKVMRLAAAIGPSWATVAHRATEMTNAFGNAGLDEDALIAAVFANPEQLDQLAQAQVDETKAKALVAREMLSDRQSLIDFGLTEQEADDILRRRDERAVQLERELTGIAQDSGPSGPTGPTGRTEA